MKVETWHGCYDGGWQGLLVPDAFAHPAKAARGLLARIFDELAEMGALRPGDIVVDPFGGIGTTGIIAASRGIRSALCELEPRFWRLANGYDCPGFGKGTWRRYSLRWTRNPKHSDLCPSCQKQPGVKGRTIPEAKPHRFIGCFDLHRPTWEAMGYPIPVMVQGDSRRLREHVGPVLAECVVGSPPFQDMTQGTNGSLAEVTALFHQDPRNAGKGRRAARTSEYGAPSMNDNYGTSPGQLGTMPTGSIDAVVSSPPYNLPMSQDHNGTRGGQRGTEPSEAGAFARYGNTPGQLEGLPMGSIDAVVSSPPYAEIATGAGGLNTKPAKPGQQGGRSPATASQDTDQRYGETDGQLARMALGEVSAVISSPPYERSMDSIENAALRAQRAEGFACGQKNLCYGQNPYTFLSRDPSGLNNDQRKAIAAQNPQIGALEGDTFWTAARDIVRECHALLRPGGYAVWIVKAFVRNGKRVDFPGDWRRLCEACGFEVVKEVRAMLVHEERRPHLFDGERVVRRERKSFFRRLSEKKGAPSIDWETVWFTRRGA
jgi:hypothetical protein